MNPSAAKVPRDDDPVVERLRETLRLEADAVAPFTGRLRSIAAIHDWRARRRTARRRVAAAVAAVAGIAVIGVSAAVVANQPLRSTTVGVGGGSVNQSMLHIRGRVPTIRPALSAPPASGGPVPVPASFTPLSATFVTSRIGYVLGTVSCSSGRCLALAGTLDGGSAWQDLGVPAPPGTAPNFLASGTVELSMRFSDQNDGWIYGRVGTQYVLWWTANQGATWQAVGQAQTQGGEVLSLEATQRRAEAAVFRGSPAGLTMISSPQSSAIWRPVSATLPASGSNPSTQLVLQGNAGWIVANAPTFVAGARLGPSGRWASWVPVGGQCGPGIRVRVAAVKAQDLFAECQAPTGAAGAAVYYSADGGSTWTSMGRLPSGLRVQAFAAASNTTLAVAGRLDGRTVIEVSESAGSRWAPVWRGSGTVSNLGFENSSQGIAVVTSPAGSELLMTYSAGLTWQRQDFQKLPLSA